MTGGPQVPVLVTGVGIASAAGVGAAEVWRRLRESPPQPVEFRGKGTCAPISFPVFQAPPYSLADAGVPPRCRTWVASERLEQARDLHHLLATTALALRDAALPLNCVDIEPGIPVFVAGESPGLDELSQMLFEMDGDRMPDGAPARHSAFSPAMFRLNGFLLPHYLARAFGFTGEGAFVNAACLSGLTALHMAALAIRSGQTDIAVVAAADSVLSVAKYLWFDSLGLYSRGGALRPFDARHPGIVFGDGGAAVVLESAGSAGRRGVGAYAEYVGSRFAQDGWKITVPRPTSARAARALRMAVADAGSDPADVDLLVPHGTGSAASDLYEARTMHEVFEGGRWPAVTALKPFVGHNLAGSALLEAVLLILAMACSMVPPTLGCEQPLPRYPVPLVTRWTARRVRVAVKLTCAFGGFSAATVFRQPASGGVAASAGRRGLGAPS